MAKQDKDEQKQTTHVTPRDVSRQLGVGVEPILVWIHRAELIASNISNSPSRPRWIIAKSDLADFLEARSNRPPTKAKRSPSSKTTRGKFI